MLFSNAALDALSHGLAVLPTGGDDGKTPLVKGFHQWKKPPAPQTVEGWVAKWPDANIGVLTGLSRVVVVDVDDPDVRDTAEKLFGSTPLIIRTPRPGFQLWYRARGDETARNLRTSPLGLPIEIKAAASIVIVPPSINPRLGRAYQFESGSWDALDSIPLFSGFQDKASSGIGIKSISEGARNASLFRHLLHQAPLCDSVEALIAVGHEFNHWHCVPQLPDAEVVKAARSAWKVEREGRNLVAGSSGAVFLSYDVLDHLAEIAGTRLPDVVLIFIYLLRKHAWRKEPFGFAAAAMAQAKSVPGIMSRARYETARDLLIKSGVLTSAGRRGRLRLYRLSHNVQPLKPTFNSYSKNEHAQIEL
jgi:hypothetical protein